MDELRTTASQPETSETRHVDVLIIGAGISGLGAAKHLTEKCPERSWLILEARDSYGGTWDLHKYPGIRSDSDLYTFGYGFKPWKGKPIAEAPIILDYLGEVISENGFEDKIRYGQKVQTARWSSEKALWTLDVLDRATGETHIYTANFLDLCFGYYKHDEPYTPTWPGMDDFKGQIIHPMQWPEDLDYTGKKILVIGSGATAATLIPNLAKTAEHVTMLQRSPTYFFAAPNRSWLAQLMAFLHVPDKVSHRIMRGFNLFLARMLHRSAKSNPKKAKAWMLKRLEKHISRDQIDAHFTPSYRPWQQRIAFVPDADLFTAISAGKASVVTDHIDRFTEKGILTQSGKNLDADIIVTATGFNLQVFGGIPFEVDGEPIDFTKTYTHRGVMLSGLPNALYFFGYLRSSWTLRVDLVADYQCRLLNHMKAKSAKIVLPHLDVEKRATLPELAWIPEEEFNPGYIKRAIHLMPKSGGHLPWHFTTDYYEEREIMPSFTFEDADLHFS